MSKQIKRWREYRKGLKKHIWNIGDRLPDWFSPILVVCGEGKSLLNESQSFRAQCWICPKIWKHPRRRTQRIRTFVNIRGFRSSCTRRYRSSVYWVIREALGSRRLIGRLEEPRLKQVGPVQMLRLASARPCCTTDLDVLTVKRKNIWGFNPR